MNLRAEKERGQAGNDGQVMNRDREGHGCWGSPAFAQYDLFHMFVCRMLHRVHSVHSE